MLLFLQKSGGDGGDGDGSGGASGAPGSASRQLPKLEQFLKDRDYTGAMTLLEFNRSSGKGSDEVPYCAIDGPMV